jgi:hypothetical protein
MTVTDRAMPYAERLLDDRELQRDLREAVSALRSGLNRAESKRRRPSRLLGDKKFKQSTQRAAAAIKDASARLRGEPPKKHRLRKFLLAAVVVGAVAYAAKEMLNEEPAAPMAP